MGKRSMMEVCRGKDKTRKRNDRSLIRVRESDNHRKWSPRSPS